MGRDGKGKGYVMIGGEAKEVMACWCGYVRGDQSTRKECPHKHGRLKKARIVFTSRPDESRGEYGRL